MAKITWTFKNEEGTNLNRYIATNVSTGEKITFDLLRGGNISVVGTPLNAENLNALITAINACYDLISSSEKDTTYTLSKNGNAIRLTSSSGAINDVTLNKSDIGLGNVDNTSDMDKPISTAQQQGLNKPLYNLGAFDTISGNVITRQTGYVDLKELSYNYESGYFYSVFINSERPAQYYQGVIISNYTPFTTWSDFVSQTTVNSTYLDSNGQIYIRNTSCSTETQLKATFKNLAQYKLSTSYTEEIIEGQPLITLDSQGSQWLRDEWEKGLNLLPTQYSNNFTISFDTYINYPISKGTYTIKPTNSGVNGTIIIKDINDIELYNDFWVNGFTFTINSDGCYIQRFWQNGTITTNIMLNKGSTALPYQEYNGSIVREKELKDKVPTTRTINGYSLNEDITLSASDVGARPSSWTPSKSDVGLSNVDNTSDLNKPISNATQQALDLKANKEYTQNALNKSLYNLGAFDKISGNVITRQTGYVDLGSLDFSYYSGVFYCLLPTKASSGSATNWLNAKYGNATRGVDISIAQDKTMQITQDGEHISIKDTTFTDPNAFNASVAGVKLIYELSTSYTEEIIEGQPLITLDSQGSQWLRDEWDKSVNLLHNGNEIKLNTLNLIIGNTYTLSRIEPCLLKIAISSSGDSYIQSYEEKLKFTYTSEMSNLNIYAISTSTWEKEENSKYHLMLNYGDHAFPYQPYNGQIIHETDLLEALKLYGEMPAMTSIDFNTSDWENIVNNQNFLQTVNTATEISQFTTGITFTGNFKGPTVYPLKSSNSISKCEITRVSGSDKLAYTASVNKNTGEIKLECIARRYEGAQYPAIYGMGYSSVSYPTDESTFKLEVGDIYDNSFTLTFTVKFKYSVN